MIPKLLLSGYNDSDMFPPSEIVPVFSKGLDKEVLTKRASMFLDIIPNFERMPGYTYIHLISVADGCTYGPNSRSDFYNGEPCEIKIPYPEKGRPGVLILDGGISKYHNTFMQAGGVYTEHHNKHSKNPPKSQGYIVAEGYNKPMKRGELLIGVSDDAWHDDLERLAHGTPLKFSIGMDANRDFCKYCGHIAHTEDEHCDHVKHNCGQWDKDGNVVAMISDRGVYHDISRVRVPAEKIAFSLKKVASGADTVELEEPTVNPDALRYMLKTANSIKRYNTVKKLAKLEKRLEAVAKNDKLNKELLKSFGHRKKASDDAIDELHKFINFAHEKEVFGGLKRCKCVLTPEEFIQLIAPEFNTPSNVRILQGGLPGIFNDTWQRADLDEFCEDTTYEPAECLDLRILRPVMTLEPDISVDTDIRLNQMLSGLQSQPKTVIICIKNTTNDLSREYASYLCDACADLDDQESMLALVRALTQQGN